MKKYVFLLAFLILTNYLAIGQSSIQSIKLDKIINLQEQSYDEWRVMLEFEPENFFGTPKSRGTQTKQKQRPKTESKSPLAIELGESFQGAPKLQVVGDNATDISKEGTIVHITNGDFVVKDKKGNVLYENTLNAFIDATDEQIAYDPRVVYDNYNDRFIAVVPIVDKTSDSNNQLAIAFSQTNKPTGKWNIYKIKVTAIVTASGTKSFFCDYPFIGITENELVVSSVYVWLNDDDSSEMELQFRSLQISKKEGYAGEDLRYKNHDNGDGTESGELKTHGICSIDTYLDNEASNAYMLQIYNDTRDYLTLHEITASLDNNPELKHYKIPLSESYYPQPNHIKQKDGNDLNVPIDRVHKAIYFNEKIYAVYSTNLGNSGFQGLCYVQIDVKEKTSELFTYTVPNTNFILPSLALIPVGEGKIRAGITFIEVSENKYPTLSAILCDENGDWSESIVLKVGTDNVGSRLGDYTSCFYQAGTNSFWASGEYGDSDDKANNWIAEIKIKAITGVENKDYVSSEAKKIHLAPNPAIENVRISFYIEEKSQGKIVLYNSEGKMIKQLYTGKLKQGNCQLYFNTIILTKGVYFIKVENANGSLIAIEKMIKK